MSSRLRPQRLGAMLSFSSGIATLDDAGALEQPAVQVKDAGGQVLGIGSVADGQLLMRRGTNVVGVNGLYDWATRPSEGLLPDIDQLGGAMNLSLWTDVADAEVYAYGDLPLVTLESYAGGRAIRLVPTQNSADAQGIVLDAVAGNFIYVGRFGVVLGGVDFGATPTWEAHLVYVDGNSVDEDRWYGAGIRCSWAAFENSFYGAVSGLTANNYWDTLLAGDEAAGNLASMIDVCLERNGTQLNCYIAAAGHPFVLADSFVVGTGTGRVGLRVRNGSASVQMKMLFTAFARLSKVPGF